MQVVIVEPEKKPVVQNIDNTLTSVQQLVGGTIQAVYPFEEPVALICNDEGKLLNLPLNRALRDSNGAIYDIVAGTFFLCAAPVDSDRFECLTDEQVQIYLERFATPEQFIMVNGDIFVLPYLQGVPLGHTPARRKKRVPLGSLSAFWNVPFAETKTTFYRKAKKPR